MTLAIGLALAILVLTLGLLVHGRLRNDVIALLVLGTLAATGLVEPEEAVAGVSPGHEMHADDPRRIDASVRASLVQMARCADALHRRRKCHRGTAHCPAGGTAVVLRGDRQGDAGGRWQPR